jgi:hypothetical protein
MDPNANLAAQLGIARSVIDRLDIEEPEVDLTNAAGDLAELVLALDEWLAKGGFLPEAWALAADTNPYGKLTEVPLADVQAEVRRIQDTPCPHCGSTNHTVVDPDGAGEYLRYCHGCGRNFEVKAGLA